MACLPCLLLPALAAGSAAAGGYEATKKRYTLMWISIAITVISIALWIFFRIRKKNCKSCTLKK